MKIYNSVAELVGSTPLLRLERFAAARGEAASVLAKLEYLNPAGSAKDRAALSMIEDAEASGALRPGALIIEPTSGNTGIALAAQGAARGYKVLLVMPDSMSAERRRLLAAYGAELVLTPAAEGMAGAVARASELAAERGGVSLGGEHGGEAAGPRIGAAAEPLAPMRTSGASAPDDTADAASDRAGAWVAGQFENPANPRAHERSTGPEIWADTDGAVDIFVAGVGTGGTLTGVARALKARKPSVRIVAVEPDASPLLSEGRAGAHGLQGIGANFVPDALDRSLIDEIVRVRDADAFAATKLLARREGLLVGISAGAAAHAAAIVANRPENVGKIVVTLLPDSGERYLSTGVFD